MEKFLRSVMQLFVIPFAAFFIAFLLLWGGVTVVSLVWEFVYGATDSELLASFVAYTPVVILVFSYLGWSYARSKYD